MEKDTILSYVKDVHVSGESENLSSIHNRVTEKKKTHS